MDTNMSPEDALSIVEKIRGPEGIEAFLRELDNIIEKKKGLITSVQSEINTFVVVKRMLLTLAGRWGVIKSEGKLEVSEVVPQSQVVSVGDNELTKEVKRRVSEGLCTYRGGNSGSLKWCNRKAVKGTSFCKVHGSNNSIEVSVENTGQK